MEYVANTKDVVLSTVPSSRSLYPTKRRLTEASGGALTHSSVLVMLTRSMFISNKAGEEGYAIMSLGPLQEMVDIAFADNVPFCEFGMYRYNNIEVQACRVAKTNSPVLMLHHNLMLDWTIVLKVAAQSTSTEMWAS